MLGDDAGRCSNGLTAQRFREATPEERAVYRKWLRRTITFYGVLFLITGFLAVAGYSNVGLTQLTKLSTSSKVPSSRTD